MQAGERDAAVRTIARDGDPDRYASALFASGACRERLFALYAFNVELARIGEQVSEPQLGEIRLQWWRDALDRACAGETTGHPVADALGLAVRECDLSRRSLADLIDARRFDVSVKIMPDTAALDDYLAKTAGALFKLACEIGMAGGRAAEPRALEQAVRAAGIAYGLTGLMRALPVHVEAGTRRYPGGWASPSWHLAGATSGRRGERGTDRALGGFAGDGAGRAQVGQRNIWQSFRPRRDRRSCRSRWSILTSQPCRRSTRCGRSPTSTRSTGFGGWEPGGSAPRREQRLLRGDRGAACEPPLEIGERARGERMLPRQRLAAALGLYPLRRGGRGGNRPKLTFIGWKLREAPSPPLARCPPVM